MDARKTVLYWTPKTDRVAVLPLGPGGDEYQCCGLAAWADVRTMDDEQLKVVCLNEAIRLIVADGCDAAAVHKALLEIDQYQSVTRWWEDAR